MVRLIQWPPAYTADGLAGCPPGQEAAQQAAILLATRRGERPDAPDFGLAAPLGGLTVNHEGLAKAVRRWLPNHAAVITARHTVDTDGKEWTEITIIRED